MVLSTSGETVRKQVFLTKNILIKTQMVNQCCQSMSMMGDIVLKETVCCVGGKVKH